HLFLMRPILPLNTVPSHFDDLVAATGENIASLPTHGSFRRRASNQGLIPPSLQNKRLPVYRKSPHLVGVPRFELGTSRTRTVRSTGLSHTPCYPREGKACELYHRPPDFGGFSKQLWVQ